MKNSVLPDERERFEAWAGPRGFDLRREPNGYSVLVTVFAFEAWQAALSQSPTVADERELERLRYQVKSLEGDLRYQIEVGKRLSQRIDALNDTLEKNVWAWVGDGTDDLESMGNHMVVSIRADHLRELVAVPTMANGLTQEETSASASVAGLSDSEILKIGDATMFEIEEPWQDGALRFGRAIIAALASRSIQIAPRYFDHMGDEMTPEQAMEKGRYFVTYQKDPFDQEWADEAKKTLDHLSIFLQWVGVECHAQGWREWIDEAKAKIEAERASIQIAGEPTASEPKEKNNEQ